MLTGVKDVLLLTGSLTARNKALLDSLLSGHVPKPHQEIDDPVRIHSSPFGLSYGADNSLMSDNDANTAFSLNLGGGRDRVGLTFESHKPPMAVGGNGETGLVKPTDMYYYSLTRCGVAGKIDIGTGWDDVARGQGWIDHQWGSSWTTQSDGWDWWGVQLGNGTDILLFEQRDLATGKAFFPLATFMDRNGRISVTRDIAFRPAARPIWRSPRSGAVYPLQWRLSFPGKHLRLLITPDVAAQEMPILSPGGDIWEGSCRVTAEPGNVHGVAYMELVGYGSPAVGGTTRRF
jgi:predicted secreted hydrolase